jgi:alpha-L-fucosidase 2
MISNTSHITRIVQALILCIFLTACNNASPDEEAKDEILWYGQAAQEWVEALPLGNGKLGIMVFGKTSNERIQLNDDSMWPGDNNWDEPAGNSEDLEKIRELLFMGQNAKADKLFVEKFSRKSIVRSHQTLGDLFIDFDHKNITEYRRELNIGTAVSTVSYKSNGNLITEKAFVSHPHKAIIIELSSQAEEGLNGKLRLTRPDDNGFPTATTKTDENMCLVMQGEVTQRNAKFDSKPAPILEGVKFETCLQIRNRGGEIIRGEDYLELKKVKHAILYLVANSSYYYEDFSGQNRIDLAALNDSDIETIRSEHIRDFQSLYSTVQFSLNADSTDTIATDQRIQRIRNDSVDPGLEVLLFQYGRYLLISSSRKGTNPANLQGLWNEHITAPWNADYHLNINLQMNYWLANMTNLSELNFPLFDYIDKLIENGKITASRNFGCAGAFIPHATDLWAPTWLRAPTAFWGCSVGAGAWLMQHYWQHFEYTRDTAFLEHRALPAMEEVVKFYSDWLIEDPRDGKLISAPSTSPENRFLNSEGDPVATCLGSAMDQQAIAEVFTNYIEACHMLQISKPLVHKIKQQNKQLRPGFVIGSDGRILEWDREYPESEPGHRHMSHLYGFHPGVSISKDKDPDVFQAVKKTLNYRLENGGAGTGWSRAWLINCSARLLDGEMAHDHIQLLLKYSIYDNLFDGHPPFQIDGNFGYTAGVAEMLLQSHEDKSVRILPALPESWQSGIIKGLRARGGLTLDIYWSQNQLDKALVYSDYNTSIKLIYQDESLPVELKKGERYLFKPSHIKANH